MNFSTVVCERKEKKYMSKFTCAIHVYERSHHVSVKKQGWMDGNFAATDKYIFMENHAPIDDDTAQPIKLEEMLLSHR